MVAATNATAFVTLSAGVAGRVLRLSSIRINGVSLTAAAVVRIGLRKYSTLGTGGTLTNPAIAQQVTSAEASTAVIRAYTVAPSGGLATPVSIREYTVSAAATAATVASSEIFENLETNRTEAPTVIGATECLGIAFLASPATAVTMSITLEWTEDNN